MTQPSTKPPSYDIEEILTRLPDLTQLFERDGHTPKKFGGGWFVRCPFHEDGSPSCHIHNERGKFHCYMQPTSAPNWTTPVCRTTPSPTTPSTSSCASPPIWPAPAAITRNTSR